MSALVTPGILEELEQENARLIAAAPELYETLAAILPSLVGLFRTRAEEVLAKAEGRTAVSQNVQDIFSLAEGTVTIQWPAPLSADSIQDLKDWLKIVERKITRSEAPPDEVKQP
jgi:hypothetical protein